MADEAFGHDLVALLRIDRKAPMQGMTRNAPCRCLTGSRNSSQRQVDLSAKVGITIGDKAPACPQDHTNLRLKAMRPSDLCLTYNANDKPMARRSM